MTISTKSWRPRPPLNRIQAAQCKNRILWFSLATFAQISNVSLVFDDRAERKAYIKAKYEDKKFVEPLCSTSQEVLLELEAAIEEHSLYDVLRCLCEATHLGVDLTDPLPSSVSTT